MTKLGIVWRSGLGPKRNFSSLFSISLLFGLLLACLISYSQDIECKGMICRGDFPAFYSAAELSLAGLDIYNADLQQHVQNKYWPSLAGRFLYFSYPPYVASIVSPLALLDPLSAKILFLTISLSALLFALRLLSKDSLTLLLAVTLSFFPSLVGLISGQNFAFSFLLFALINFALREANKQNLAGLAVGLWIFKPHFALLAYLGLFFCRLWKAATISTVIFLAIYCVTTIQYGLNWPIKWLVATKVFYLRDIAENGYQMVSLLSYFENLNLASVGILLGLSFLSVFYYLCCIKGVSAYLAMLPAAIVLCSPHTMYYDLPLILAPLLARPIRFSHIQTCLVLMLASSLFIFRKSFYVSPMIALPFFALIFNYATSRKNSQSE